MTDRWRCATVPKRAETAGEMRENAQYFRLKILLVEPVFAPHLWVVGAHIIVLLRSITARKARLHLVGSQGSFLRGFGGA